MNMGCLVIEVINGNYCNCGELMLMYWFDGVEFKFDYVGDMFVNFYCFWKCFVYI